MPSNSFLEMGSFNRSITLLAKQNTHRKTKSLVLKFAKAHHISVAAVAAKNGRSDTKLRRATREMSTYTYTLIYIHTLWLRQLMKTAPKTCARTCRGKKTNGEKEEILTVDVPFFSLFNLLRKGEVTESSPSAGG
jgi:hypothetical protein